MKKLVYLFPLFFMVVSCENKEATQEEAQAFLDQYTEKFLRLNYICEEADWKANTYIKAGDTTNSYLVKQTNEARAAFIGDEENINQAKAWIERKEMLTPLQIKQFEKILYRAANNPSTAPDLVKRRIASNTLQVENLFGFDYKIHDTSVTANTIDKLLQESNDLKERLEAWSASKEVGKGLKSGLSELQSLRNKTVQTLGYNDYFTYQVSDYDMEVDEMLSICQNMVRDVWPLYRELHTYARYELAKKYGQEEVPEMFAGTLVAKPLGAGLVYHDKSGRDRLKCGYERERGKMDGGAGRAILCEHGL